MRTWSPRDDVAARGFLPKSTALANQLDIPYIFPNAAAVDREAAALVTPKWALANLAVPIVRAGNALTVVAAEPLDDSLARVMATRVGQAPSAEGQRSFVIDFKGAGDIPENLVPEVWSSAGKVFAPRGHVVEQTGAYRLAFELEPGREEIIELRTVLLHDGKPWSETWLYQWTR